jgi:ComF family protein
MKIFSYLLDLIYPPRCIFCRNIISIDKPRGICTECNKELPFVVQPMCEKCGKPLKDSAHAVYCHDCFKQSHEYDQSWAVFVYEGIVRQTIYRFKYGDHPEYAKYLGIFMAKQLQQLAKCQADLIIPVPIHHTRKKQRGYNQAEKLVKVISYETHIPYDSSVLLRIKETKPQSGLSPKQRKNNLKKAFGISDDSKIKQKKILLVDDIYTTGSTADCCSRLLKQKGAKEVYVLSLCIGADS